MWSDAWNHRALYPVVYYGGRVYDKKRNRYAAFGQFDIDLIARTHTAH